jgi:hypothetical protein
MYWRVPVEGKESEFGMLFVVLVELASDLGYSTFGIGAHMEAISTERVLWLVVFV